MGLRWAKIAFTLICILWCIFYGNAQEAYDERHIEVSLRMIGHQVLLNSNDTSSRIMPIEKVGDRYRISFASEFAFIPEDLVATVDSVVMKTRIANGYIMEVEKCETGEVVYSYEMDKLEQTNIIPCQARFQPESCYNLLFTLIERRESNLALQNSTPGPYSETGQASTVIGILLLLLGGAFFVLRKKRKKSTNDPNVIPLGDYQFDKRNSELIREDQRTELTGKEADLLTLLYDAVNTTVKREEILNMVWGDEGDYVGRTLDVFISKLRKKLEADSSVKIVNIRGVGYKLVMDV